MLNRLRPRAAALLAVALGWYLPVHSVAAQEAGHEHGQHAAPAADSADPHAHHKAMMNKQVEAAESADVDLRDRALLDQDGREVKFVSDVIGDRIVVMDFIYTHCTTVCPVLSAVLAEVQNRLGDQLGDQVALVSVSVDPIRDTPQRLKAYAAKHKARPGWTWLTGPKSDMDDVLIGVGAYSVNFEDHPPWCWWVTGAAGGGRACSVSPARTGSWNK